MKLDKRVADLEAKTAQPMRQVHQVRLMSGQTQDEVLEAYGRDRIAAADLVIINRIVVPPPLRPQGLRT